jgi:hypothetical protein
MAGAIESARSLSEALVAGNPCDLHLGTCVGGEDCINLLSEHDRGELGRVIGGVHNAANCRLVVRDEDDGVCWGMFSDPFRCTCTCECHHFCIKVVCPSTYAPAPRIDFISL